MIDLKKYNLKVTGVEQVLIELGDYCLRVNVEGWPLWDVTHNDLILECGLEMDTAIDFIGRHKETGVGF